MQTSTLKEELRGIFRTLLIALAIVLPIRFFIAQPFIVRGASMEPNFKDGEYLVVDELSYRFQEPKRGDVIVFRYPNDPRQFFIKRIIGLPGEAVSVQGGEVHIQEKGSSEDKILKEPYLDDSVHTFADTSVTLKEGEFFVLGDNRPSSSDSRVWGTLPENYLVGKAIVRLLPPSRISLL
jgi:signal peptidase I